MLKMIVLSALVLSSLPAFAGDRSLCEANSSAPMCSNTPVGPISQNPALVARANVEVSHYLWDRKDQIVSSACRWLDNGFALSCRFTTARKHDCTVLVNHDAKITCRK